MVAASECGVPVVLDRVVGAAGEETSNRSPFVPMSSMGLYDGSVFVWAERAVLYLGAQLVAPP